MMKEYNDSGEEPLIASLVIDAGFASLEAGGPQVSPALSKVVPMVVCAYGITATLRCGTN